MLHAALKSVLARKLRLTLTAMSVVLGVAFVTGTFLLTDTISKAFDDVFAEVDRNTSVAVRSRAAFESGGFEGETQRAPVTDSLLERVRAVDGVEEAVGLVEGSAQVVNPRTRKTVNTDGGAPGLGESWVDSKLSPLTLESGAAPRAPTEIAVDRDTFRSADLRLGQSVTVLTPDSSGRYTVVGVLRFGSSNDLAGATITAFTPETAQRVLLGRADAYSIIKLSADAGVSQEELRQRVAAVLPAGTEALTGEALAKENADSIQEAFGFFNIFLLVFAGIALFVGAFIIFNTFTILIAQRLRELALMRALGASRRQVNASVLIEAVVVGLVGSTVGLLLGFGVAAGLKGLFGAVGADLPSGGVVFRPRTIIAAYLVGMLVTMAAALVPAVKAGRVPPVAAMHDVTMTPTRTLRLRAILGTAVTAVGGLLLFVGLFQGGSNAAALVGLGAGLTFMGVTTLSPFISRPVVRVLGAPFTRLFGSVGRLGIENARRNPRRTAATAAALMIGLALVSAVSVLAASIKATTRDIVSTSLGAEYILSTQNFTGFSPDVAARITRIEGVDVAAGFRFGAARIDGASASVNAIDPAALRKVLSIEPVQGDLGSLAEGTLLVEERTLTNKGWSLGQPVEVTFQTTGAQRLRIGGTYEENQLAGPYLISLSTYERNFPTQFDSVVAVKLDGGADAGAVRPRIEAAVRDYPNLTLRDQAQFVQSQEDQVNQLLYLIYVLLALAVVIAAMGVINTLALSVIERTREIGLLRAVGLSRRQLRRAVRVESVVISLYGALLGVAIGSLFGWALVKAGEDSGLSSFAYPTGTLLLVLVVGALIGVIAAAFPARRAARLNILEAIATT
jgi:putative ABC transport system permease protein